MPLIGRLTFLQHSVMMISYMTLCKKTVKDLESISCTTMHDLTIRKLDSGAGFMGRQNKLKMHYDFISIPTAHMDD